MVSSSTAALDRLTTDAQSCKQDLDADVTYFDIVRRSMMCFQSSVGHSELADT